MAVKYLSQGSSLSSAAYLSIDTATFIIQNVSIRALMRKFRLYDYERVSFTRSELRIHPGNDAFSFNINGVQFMINRTLVSCYGLDIESNDIFDYVFPSIRLNITGEGMKFLRCVYQKDKLWFDQCLLNFVKDNPQWVIKCTRLDFALDIINDVSNILNNVVQHLQYGGTKDGQPGPGMFTAGATRSYKTDMWFNPSTDGCTVYIGSSSSDQRLRIYNKYSESRDYFSVPYRDVNGVEHFSAWKEGKKPTFDGFDPDQIKTWVRFELVLRNDHAQSFLAPEEGGTVLDHPGFFGRLIMEKFRPVSDSLYIDWWLKFWEPLKDDSKVNLNLHFVQSPISAATRIVNSMSTTFATNQLICYMLCGAAFMQRFIQRYLLWIQCSATGSAKALIKVKQVLTSEGIFIEDLGLVFDDKLNAWQLPGIPLLTKAECINQYQRQFGSRFGWSWDLTEV